ncbi:MAG TPA: arginase family protein [Streptosporangiaceae bacterium]|nr:arginase family protein [Streptosporangiaceae bacterium]
MARHRALGGDLPDRSAADRAGAGGRRRLALTHLALSLRGLAGMRLVGADVVEVSPAYDHAEMTTVAAAHVVFELLALMLLGRAPGR